MYRGEGNRDIVFPAVTAVVQSESGDPTACVVDCQGSARDEHRGFHFTSDGDGFATLSGVGIINGYVSGNGGGVWIDGVDASLHNCRVVSCTAAGGRGGGVYVGGGGAPAITQSLLSANTADYGGGLAVESATAVCQLSEFNDNSALVAGGGIHADFDETGLLHLSDVSGNSAPRAGGVSWAGNGDSTISLTTICRNEATGSSGGGVWLRTGFITQCTIADNAAVAEGGGIYCDEGTGLLNHSIIAFSSDGEGVAATAGNIPTLSCCDVYGNEDGNYDATVGDQTGVDLNFSEDPRFCGLEISDYRLLDTSPCLPGAGPCVAGVGVYGEGCDSPVEPSSWGRVKALWR
jgi:hypothetical protein